MQLAYATRGSLIIGFSVAIIATILSGSSVSLVRTSVASGMICWL